MIYGCLVQDSNNFAVVIGECAGGIKGVDNNGVIIGREANRCGGAASNNSANVIIGCMAGYKIEYHSQIAIGTKAAYNTCGSGGWTNTVIGYCAAYSNTSGQGSVFVGPYAGQCIASGNYNAIFGQKAGRTIDAGGNNAIFGANAGSCFNSGSSGNTFIGKYAARCQTGGSTNVAIGCDARLESSTGSNQLSIGLGANYWLRGDSSYNIRPGAGIEDCDGATGSSGQVLSSTGSAIKWTAAGGGGAGFSPDSQGNLYAGTSAGACSDSDTLCNIAIGECAGCKLDAGDFNVILGNNAGRNTTTGKTNFFGGYSAGCANVSGCYNVMFGLGAGKCPTAGNSRVFIGQGAGEKSCGNFNTFIGYYAGQCAGTGGSGSYNVAFGYAEKATMQNFRWKYSYNAIYIVWVSG